MRIKNVTISGFRSFGPDPVNFELAGDLTVVIGPNAAGKTALLQALAKLFGVTRAQRTIHRTDFHLAPNADPADRTPRDLFIDVIIELPEFAKGSATAEAIAPTFRHMRIEHPNAPPKCRLRLKARWEDDGTLEGEVSQELYWVDTLDAAPNEEQYHPVSPSERGLIQLYYTPASRDAEAQIRATTGALAARLLRAIEWSESTKKAVEEASQGLQATFNTEAAIKAISAALAHRWSALHDEKTDTMPSLSLIGRRFEEVVNHINVVFQQGPMGIERGLESLSDGQQSLFYFALAAAVFDLERDAVANSIEGFHAEELTIPALSIFAIEEPENHLSPYYLARIVNQVRSLVSDGAAQAIVTSHSPAVLSRVEPKEVRYCRCEPQTRLTSISAVPLPEDDQEAAKFVRGAMLAFPELYFARFVVLVEGDSERVVLPRLAQALGLLIDPAFVAIVPLGGRHVQYFWRLLNGLRIPYATLLDLDVGREGGGFGRVKTAIMQLLAIGFDKNQILSTGNGVLSDAKLANMHTWSNEHLDSWVGSLKRYGVYFSSPLDFDMSMLAAFQDAYTLTIPSGGGPKTTVEKAAEAVLSKGGLIAYEGKLSAYKPLLPAYRYHFLTHSKPATHLRALVGVDDETLSKGMPNCLRSLFEQVKTHLRRD
ncbi:ATP-dependent nuclease [Cystobacter ferrugineus]|uniref:ATP-dependent endonuclease n=1 Tax=Cystobacter ferrugineus TaxID=83449 RepID=A0A1L9BHT1_9BACT|nr:AAA family ATPase [Cystobacter ferrugineus]OJH41789.1 ATP-dependent endonuclease [Cystobacter ferrugineus]